MNIFDIPKENFDEELIEEIYKDSATRIERIVSCGQKSKENFYFDQAEDEFIVLIQGQAKLSFEMGREIVMDAGDNIFIPAHEKHRVDYTSTNPKCIWLCTFLKNK